MRIKTATILAAAMAAATLTTAHAADLHVRDFGAIPDDGKDDTDAVQKAVDAAQPGDTIHFDKGVYWFDNDNRRQICHWHYFGKLPGQGINLLGDPKDKRLAGFIQIEGKKGLRLRGAVDEDEKPATTLMRKNPMVLNKQPSEQVLILESEGITIENFKLTMDQRFSMVWEITEVGPDYIVGHVPEGYPFLEGSDLRMIMRPRDSLSMHHTAFFDLKMRQPWKTLDAGKRLQRLECEPGKVEVGDVLVRALCQSEGQSSLAAIGGKDVAVRNVWVDKGPRSGSHFVAVRDLTIDGLYVHPEGGFLMANGRDGVTINSPRGTLDINRLSIFSAGDDIQPSWEAGLAVRKIVDARTILYRTSWVASLWLDELPSEVWWVNPETGDAECIGNCIEITHQTLPPPDDGGVPWSMGNMNSAQPVGRLVLDRDLPKGLREFRKKGNERVEGPVTPSMVWFPACRADKVRYQNSSLHYGGGWRYCFPKDSLVRNVALYRSGVAVHAQCWWGGEFIPWVGDVDWKDCAFLDSGVHIKLENPSGKGEPSNIRDVNLRDNLFIGSAVGAENGWRDSVVENNGTDKGKVVPAYLPSLKQGVVEKGTFPIKLLLADPFIRNKYSIASDVAWTPISGTWVIDSDCQKFYKQTDASAAPKVTLAGADSFDHCIIKVNVRRIADKGTVGVIAAATDAKNHLRLELDGAKARLVRLTEGKAQTLAEAPFASPAGAWHNLKLDTNGGKFTGFIDSEPVVEAPASGPTAGRIGLFSQGNRAHFDDVIAVEKTLKP